MKPILLFISFLFVMNMSAQSTAQNEVKQTIIKFFDAFHKQDTTVLESLAKGNIKMQSVSVNKEGKTVLSENLYHDFIKSIASISKANTFEEKLLGFDIKVDGHMAHAWTPYEFWYNGNFSHCGVNSFQLIREENKWKIIYLVDTRYKKRCKN